jgi:hypothetical protein
VLTSTKFVVTEQSKMLTAKGVYDIIDGDTKKPLGTAAVRSPGLMATLFGALIGKDRMTTTIDIRQKADDALVFSIRRKGWFFSKVQLLDGQGQVIGTYKTKKLSLAGGYHIYDKDGKHFAEVRGKLLKSEYKFLLPDGTTEMGTVSKQWGGMARELFSSAKTYGIEIAPRCAEDSMAKMLIIGGAVAINAIFSKKGGAAVAGKEASDEGGDDE